MAAGPLALGIDVGTSGVRAALLAPGGAVEGFAAAAMADHGADRREPAVWARTLAAALAGLDASARARVRAVAVDGTSGTVLALDAAGDPIGSALMYDDAVADPALPQAIAAAAPRDSAAHGAASGLARAMALATRPGAVRVLHQADWVAAQFSGRTDVTDESNALKTGYDPVARRWPGWLAAGRFPLGLLPPEVAPAGGRTGVVTPEAARRFGLPAGAAVVAGVTDGCASFLATGADAPGDGVTALGTTLTLKLLSDRPVFAPEYGVYSHRIGGMWLAGGASNTGGGALAAPFSPERMAALSARIDPETESGLDYYPLARPGERFPHADPAMAPRVTPRPEDDALFLKGLFEGVARVEALGYRRLAELGAPTLARLRSVGGGARDAAFTAIRRRMLGVPFACAASEAAAAGVARLALGALG